MVKKSIRILLGVLTVLVLLGPVTVFAGNVTETKKFSDVKESDWFYDYIITLTKNGAINGNPDGSFGPNREITCSEYTKILLIALEYDIISDANNTKTNPPPSHWAQDYIDTAQREGLITDEDTEYEPDGLITRALMIKIMMRALDIDPVYLEKADLPFADTDDEYASAAWMNYILSGIIEDNVRRFKGDSLSSRAEACAIIVRACEYKTNPSQFKEAELIKYASANPMSTKFELINYFCYINRNFMESITLNSLMSYEAWSEIYIITAGIYPEYIMSVGYDCRYYRNSNYFDLKILYEADWKRMAKMSKEADEAAEYAAKIIRSETGDKYEQIKLVHDYIAENCVYDYKNYINNTLPYDAYTAYGALVKGSAVCQGYSAAFNLICKKLGIETYSVTGTAPGGTGSHMWNIVRVDGLQYFIDVTSDDPVCLDGRNIIIYDNFMLTKQQFKINGYTWNENYVNDLFFKLLY